MLTAQEPSAGPLTLDDSALDNAPLPDTPPKVDGTGIKALLDGFTNMCSLCYLFCRQHTCHGSKGFHHRFQDCNCWKMLPRNHGERINGFLEDFGGTVATVSTTNGRWPRARARAKNPAVLFIRKILPSVGKAASAASGRTDFFAGTHQLPTPFTALPLDVHPTPEDAIKLSQDIKAGRCSLQSLNLHIPKLGRPLWNDHILYRDEHHLLRCRAIASKLVGGSSWRWPSKLPDLDVNLDDGTFQGIMALVLQRVPMGRSCAMEQMPWHEFVKRQISYNLRYLEKVHPYPDVIKSHVVSEPPLSVAAAWSFRHEPSKIALKWSTAIMTLAFARTSVGLDIGLEGKEGVQLVCSMAADFAAGQLYQHAFANFGSDDNNSARYECSMGLVWFDQWLDILIGSKYDPRLPRRPVAQLQACR
ncbi:hypothetical protein EX895_002981 [Sporisorium graminicola]|uniref:Uncharacterized protein n=1 Tax=Sporisorium graminicola TaxID=280036 RepID=A0A4U7KTF1_9BASI|nr:hypothetical protein EX895_002981 [Sporisorium graminicola]TKY87885.1 hypothetical protein EX895_002981 [Sporisorium graminicola]